MRLATALALLLLVAAPAFAQTPGNCDPGTAEADLDISDVRATLFNGGNLFFGNTTTSGDGYIVPKFSGHSPLFAAGIWIGGLVDDDVRVAAATYGDFEFWPGPLNEDGTLPDPDDCSAFDRIFVVDALDVQLYEETGTATDDLADWPVDLGAPVIDGDGVEGNYNLDGGDRPEVYGHQTAFWVMNDVGNVHANTETEPIGLEVRVTAFSSLESVLEQQTFYRYELVNRNSEVFEAARFGLFSDPDLGDANDDYVGSDSTRGMAFVYNEGETDAIYGTPPPAVGYDFLSGGDVSMYFVSGAGIPTSDPSNGAEVYNVLNGLWKVGTPMVTGGNGYPPKPPPGGDTLTWAYPGDPESEQFWSEVNVDGDGTDNPSDDRRHFISSPPFTLAPGESRTFDLAILFATGADNLNSVTALKARSDAVQARYDDGALFVPSTLDFPPPGTLATPELLTPDDGATVADGTAELSWTAVTGAEGYRVETATEPDFTDRRLSYTAEPSLLFVGETENEVLTYYWRVQAIAGIERSLYSEVRSFTYYRYVSDDFGGGTGIVETAYPGADPCPDADDPGCDDYPGNTVWLDPNSTNDYVITAPGNELGTSGLGRYFSVIDADFELRFTEACATPGTCLGLYELTGDGEIVSVPFELWNLQDPDTDEDDVRMIPVPLADGGEPVTDWSDYFGTTMEVVAGSDTLELPITDRIYWMMPDRPDGYAQFAAAANAAGGPGALYPYDDDPDTQIDIDPATDEPCANQGVFIDYCYEGAGSYVYPIGRMFVADLAGDGTTPPAGTTVRFDANDRLLDVGAEDDAPTHPQAFALEAAYPNPFASTATVGYRLERSAEVRLSVFDVLGRRVAVLVDGEVTAGSHRATFDGAGLASGVYLVVLEADGQRQTKKVMLVR